MSDTPVANNDTVLSESVNDVVKEAPNSVYNINDIVQRTAKRFIENKIDSFPAMCDVLRVMNQKKLQEFQTQENPKGWSENKNFKWDFDIPTELYNFMINLVYRDFWSDDNKKIWRPFLKALLRGDDPIETLMKVKMIYGSTIEAEKAGIV
jgi:hypothetical protein